MTRCHSQQIFDKSQIIELPDPLLLALKFISFEMIKRAIGWNFLFNIAEWRLRIMAALFSRYFWVV